MAKVFEIIGAGEIRISESANWQCGGKVGFSLDFKLGDKERFYGGVLPKDKAIELAEFILKHAKN